MSAYKKRLQSRRKLKPASVMLHHAAKMSSKGISLGWHKMVTFAKTPSVKQHDCRGREKVLNLKGRRGQFGLSGAMGIKLCWVFGEEQTSPISDILYHCGMLYTVIILYMYLKKPMWCFVFVRKRYCLVEQGNEDGIFVCNPKIRTTYWVLVQSPVLSTLHTFLSVLTVNLVWVMYCFILILGVSKLRQREITCPRFVAIKCWGRDSNW